MGDFKRKRKSMTEKYIHYGRKEIFAICYASERILYYNIDFDWPTKIYLFINDNADAVSKAGGSAHSN